MVDGRLLGERTTGERLGEDSRPLGEWSIGERPVLDGRLLGEGSACAKLAVHGRLLGEGSIGGPVDGRLLDIESACARPVANEDDGRLLRLGCSLDGRNTGRRPMADDEDEVPEGTIGRRLLDGGKICATDGEDGEITRIPPATTDDEEERTCRRLEALLCPSVWKREPTDNGLGPLSAPHW